MKKILVLSNLVLLSVIGVLSLQGGCRDKTEKSDRPGSDETTYTCTECPNTNPPASVKMGYFKELVSNYRNNHWSAINNAFIARGTNQVDSRSVWFDLNTLKSFIATIENKVNNECGNHCEKGLGIRIYFGEYDATNSPKTDYVNLHTLIMVPTIKDRNKFGTPEENVDFDPDYLSSCKPMLPPDTADLDILLPTINTTDMTAMNHGEIIPPPPPPNSMFCTGAKFMHWVDKMDNPSLPTCP
jgi:hypothetical protein